MSSNGLLDPSTEPDCPECANGVPHEVCRVGWKDAVQTHNRKHLEKVGRFSTDKKYLEWIVQTIGDIYWGRTMNGHFVMRGTKGSTEDGEPLAQRCDVAAPMLAEAFPGELTVVRGAYRSETTKNWWMYHVWCVDKSGLIVDPTGRQFDSFGETDSYKKGEYRAGK